MQHSVEIPCLAFRRDRNRDGVAPRLIAFNIVNFFSFFFAVPARMSWAVYELVGVSRCRPCEYEKRLYFPASRIPHHAITKIYATRIIYGGTGL